MKKQDMKLVNRSLVKDVSYEELFRQQPRDLVLICEGGVQLEYHCQVLLNISKTLTSILENERLFGNFFLPNALKVYVTIDGIEARTAQTIMETIYKSLDLKCVKEQRNEIRNFLEVMGITDKFYTIVEEENEDEVMADVICNLINDFDSAPATSSQTDLVEFLMEGLDDNFINDISSSFDGENSLLNMESLLSEDHEEEFNIMEELGEERKITPQRSLRDMKIRPCSVDLENIPTETLSHYFGILKRKQALDQSKIEAAPTPVKRKKKTKKSSEHFSEKNEVNAKTDVEIKTPEQNIPRDVSENSNSLLQDSRSANSSFSQASEVEVVEVKELHCVGCSDKFPSRSRLFQHMTVSHFQKQILELFPYVLGECSLCIEQGRPKPFVPKKKQSHLLHIGQTHAVVLQFVPEEFKEKLEEHHRNQKGKRRSFNKMKIKQEMISFDDSSDFNTSSVDSFYSANESFQESFANSVIVGGSSAAPSAAPQRFFHDEDANMSAPVQEVECSICPRSDSVSFQVKSEMLSHLSWIHLSAELLTLFPPLEDNKCSFCQDGLTSQEEYIKHIGIVHEKVLEVLPSDFCEKILSMQDKEHVQAEPAAESDEQSSCELTESGTFEEPRKLDFKSILSHSSQAEDREEVKSPSEEFYLDNERKCASQARTFSCRYCREHFTESRTYRLHLLAHREIMINKAKN